MARRFSMIAVLTVVLCFLPGCFTIGSQATNERGSRVFTGTRAHVMSMSSGYLPWARNNSYWLPKGGGGLPLLWWHPLDIPLSFAADIAMLPYTVPAQLIWGDLEFNNPKLRFLIAGATNDMALARELIEEHPKFAHEQNDGRPFLAIAAATGRPKFVALLLERGADVDSADKYGNTPLHYAGSPFLALSASFLFVHEREALQKQARYVDVARLLIEHGAKVTARGQWGETPLHDAAGGGHVELAKFLIERGADVNTRIEGGGTPLHNAVYSGHVEMIRFLIERGADVNARGRLDKTPLAAALRFRNSRVAALLRAHGGKK